MDDDEIPVRGASGREEPGIGMIALLGVGVFVASILTMVVINLVGGALTGLARSDNAELVAFEPPPATILTRAPAPDAPAWLAHAAPFDAPPGKPLLAVVVLDDGTHSPLAMQAVNWRAPLSFAIAADFDVSPFRIEQVRRAGREALALLPLGYAPEFGRDPNVLRRGLSDAELLRRLRWHLARAGEGIIGAVDQYAGDITRDMRALRTIGDGLAAGGLLMVESADDPDSLLSARLRPLGVPVGRRTTRVARGGTADAAFAALVDAERHAFTWGTAIVLVEADGTSMQALSEWLESRGGSIALAPVSHVVRRLRTGPRGAMN